MTATSRQIALQIVQHIEAARKAPYGIKLRVSSVTAYRAHFSKLRKKQRDLGDPSLDNLRIYNSRHDPKELWLVNDRVSHAEEKRTSSNQDDSAAISS